MSAGALESPKLLLLSGIGPKADLSKLYIPGLPDVGKPLCDCLLLELVGIRQAGSQRCSSYRIRPEGLKEAREQWNRDRSGPLAGHYLPQMIGDSKNDKVSQSEEFQELDGNLHRALIAGTKPHFEMVSVGMAAAFEGSCAARGSVTLKSAHRRNIRPTCCNRSGL